MALNTSLLSFCEVSGDSALIVSVPEAEPVIGRTRWRLDPSGRAGMPAHVTVLYPFLSAEEFDAEAEATLSVALARREPFRFTMPSVDWFGERILYLTTEPDEPFKKLTAAVVECFPHKPPYGGLFDGNTPHVTVASKGRSAVLKRVARRLAQRLPISAEANEVVLMALDQRGRWREMATFPLGDTKGLRGERAVS